MEFPTPEVNCAKGVFQISSQGQWKEKLTWLDIWNLLTINYHPLALSDLVPM